MKGLKVNMDMVNCVLLVVVLVLVIVCCVNREKFENNFLKPDCTTLFPCVNGGVNSLRGQTWEKNDKFYNCKDDIYRFPEHVFEQIGGDLNHLRNYNKVRNMDEPIWEEAKQRSCRKERKDRQKGKPLSTFCKNRINHNKNPNKNYKLLECGFNKNGAFSGSMMPDIPYKDRPKSHSNNPVPLPVDYKR